MKAIDATSSLHEAAALRLLTAVDAELILTDGGSYRISAKGLDYPVAGDLVHGWKQDGLLRCRKPDTLLLSLAGRDRAAELNGRPFPSLIGLIPWLPVPPGQVGPAQTKILAGRLRSCLLPGVYLCGGRPGRPWTLERPLPFRPGAVSFDLLAYVPESVGLAAVQCGLVSADQGIGRIYAASRVAPGLASAVSELADA